MTADISTDFMTHIRRGEFVLMDGALGTELERRGVPFEGAGWSALAVRDHGDVIRQTHADYIRAGARIHIVNSFALARTVEYFRIPRTVLTICLGKSTYARCGIIVNVTPLEPEWEGHVTLEFSNTTPLPAKIYANEGVAQMLFLESDEECETSYRDRGGKYQGQTGVTLPKA